jgi:DnaJ-class molecular chaperone
MTFDEWRAAGEEPPAGYHRSHCKRCGGTGWQQPGRYWNWIAGRFQDEGAGFCLECGGTGTLGLVPDDGNIGG